VDNGEEFWWFAVFATSNTFTTTSPLPEMRKVERNEVTDRFCFTIVFLLNELFVTVHVDDILNTDNNK